MENIIVKKSYFDNIETAINSLNQFFSSNFKQKNFPVIDNDYQLDDTISKILGLMNGVESSWIENTDEVERIVDAINAVSEKYDDHPYEQICDNNDSVTIDHIDAFISFKALQFIADHFEEFSKLMNGIYTMELFLKPSKYKETIDLFSQDINVSELETVSDDIHTPIFDGAAYIKSLFDSDQVTIPKSIDEQEEVKRFYNYQDASYEINIDDSDSEITPVQEAAEVNYFTKRKPVHIRYDEKKDKFHISAQFRKSIDQLKDGLEKCKNSEDLLEFFDDPKGRYPEADDFSSNVLPFILAKVFNNTKKYPNQDMDMTLFRPYINSYKSIADNNPGAKRFVNYDLFSTFKTDKRGTIRFIMDFCEINLYNDPAAAITNNNLLTIFNIFDSRIYFDILYNLIPDKVKKAKYPSEDDFVKRIRGRINKNSRNTNVYKPVVKAAVENDVPTADDLMEYTTMSVKEFGDMSISDMMLCEHYTQILRDEINTLDARIYNEGLSPIRIDWMLRDYKDSVIQEVDKGGVPEYMKTRVRLSDEMGTTPRVTQTEIQIPPDTPTNSVDELVDSIDSKMDIRTDDIGDMLGADANVTKNGTNIVYNITYNNSFNRDDHSNHSSSNSTSSNDLSSGKNINKSNNVTNTHSDSHNSNSSNTPEGSPISESMDIDEGLNNNNNSNGSVDTKDSKVQEFASGYAVDDVFAFLESEEPLSTITEATTKPPKGQSLTATLYDVDRNTRNLQQKSKRAVQKGIGTAKALLKPATRTKQWLASVVDSLINRHEDAVKTEIIENDSYRSTLFKASRLALKLGMAGIAFTLNTYIGVAYVALQASKVLDKERLKKEVENEMATEIEILDYKIQKADEAGDVKAVAEMKRLRSKMTQIASGIRHSNIKHPRSVS